jgi:UDP-N-acetylglucosamine 2-epimerase (non-hydrolysing)
LNKILAVLGTRPEAIKMAPVIKLLSKKMIVRVCVTAQHREMLDQVLNVFDIKPDYDLDIMLPGQDLFDVTTNVLQGIKQVLSTEMPDVVLVHGDTTTAMATSLAAFYKKIPIGHVEAGLRTYNPTSPFPEEINRQIIGRLTKLHFVPTERARQNLLNEGVGDSNITVTGNTVVDALLSILEKARTNNFPKKLIELLPFLDNMNESKMRIILVTCHRRENFGTGFEEICKALNEIALMHPNVHIIYPVHLNPNVLEPVERILSPIANIHLIKPMDYLSFVKLMDASYLILTDSGGIQEEAPSLGVPVLVIRETTERPEAVDAGTVKLIGTNHANIVEVTNELLTDENAYKKMAKAINPYGDGTASEQICKALKGVVL